MLQGQKTGMKGIYGAFPVSLRVFGTGSRLSVRCLSLQRPVQQDIDLGKEADRPIHSHSKSVQIRGNSI